jgi:GPH family glycoside/pentoside/hexuronide:cation symporter
MENRMKFRTKLAYGVGDFGSNYCWTFVSAFALIYFTDTAGVNAAAVGTIIMAAKILDGITDVFMGNLMDRTKSKMGKARPWLFWSAFPLMAALVLLFNVPASFSALGKNIYIFIVYTFLGAVCYTASNISYNALVSLAASDPQDRVTMGSVRFVFAILAGMVISSTTMALVNAFGGGQRGWTGVSILYALVFCVFTMITVFGVKELKTSGGESPAGQKPAETIGFGKSMILLAKNKYFLIMLGLNLISQFSGGIAAAVGIYYVSYVLGQPALLGLFSIAGVIPMIVLLPLTPKLTAKFGMRRTILTASFLGIAGGLIKMVSNNSIPVILTAGVIAAFGLAPYIGAQYALVAESAEYAFLKFKTRMDGTIYSCCSVGIKIGSGLGVALTGWLLSASGYDGAASVQSQGAINMIQNIYLVSPLFIAIATTLLLTLLDVEKTNASLRAGLNANLSANLSMEE